MPGRKKMFTARNMALGAGALAVVGGGAVFWMNREKPPEYQTATVTRGDLEVTISAAGKVQPKFFVDVGAQVSGQLETFLFEVGERVDRGELLAEIDQTLAAARVEADRAQLRELEASFAQQEASLELSKANAERAQMLYAADAISQAQYQAAEADNKIAAARLEQLKAQISRAESTLEADLASLSFTKIYAPMTGTIVSQSAVVGQTLNANQTTPTILRIADLSVMTVEADVSEADVLRIRAGQPAYFTTLGGGARRWSSTVRQVLPQPEIVNDVVLYKVLLDVENKEEELKPEMTAQVFFVAGRAEDAVLAPVAALRDMRERGGRDGSRQVAARERREGGGGAGIMAARASEGGDADAGGRRDGMRAAREAHPDAEQKMVMVIENGEARPRPVLVGVTSRVQAEILWGLEPGEEVVTGMAVGAAPANRQGPPGPPAMGRRGPR